MTSDSKTPGVYSSACQCCQVSTIHTGQSNGTRVREYHQHICSGQMDKPVLAEHNFNADHHRTPKSSTQSNHTDYSIKDMSEAEVHSSITRRMPFVGNVMETSHSLCADWRKSRHWGNSLDFWPFLRATHMHGLSFPCHFTNLLQFHYQQHPRPLMLYHPVHQFTS